MATKTKASRAAKMAANNARIAAAQTKAGVSVERQAAANASALSSVNKVRASQGVAEQTAIGVPAAGRSGVLTIDQSTNEVKDAAGNTVATGTSLADAIAKQTQISSGSAPTVAGRPDLFAVAPGAKQEAKPFMDASTKTLVTPRVATEEELAAQAAGTLRSFNASRGLTYLDGETFKNLRSLLNESDLIRGPNGQIWLRQGLSPEQVRARAATSVADTVGGVTGGTIATDFTVDVPNAITTDTIDELMNTPVTESDFNTMMQEIQAQQDELLGLMVPSDAEQAIKAEVVDLKAQIEKTLTELSMGLNNVEDQPIAMQFITGQQASIERSANAKLQNLARLEQNLLYELGLEQEAREVEASVAQTKLGYLQTNLDVAFKVKQMLQQEEDSIFNRARALKQDAQSALSSILETMAGIDESDMTREQQKQLQDMAIAAGIPYSLLTAGLRNVKLQMNADATGDFDAPEIKKINGIDYQWNRSTGQWEEISVTDAPAELSQLSQSALELVDTLINHPGRAGATGASSLTPAMPGSDRADFESHLERFKALLSLENIQYLKGTGAMSDREFATLSSAAAALQGSMSEEGFLAELQRVQSELLSEQGMPTGGGFIPVDQSFDSVDSLIRGLEEKYPAVSDVVSRLRQKGWSDQSILEATELNGGLGAFSNDLSTSQNGSPLEIAQSYLGMNASDPKQAQTLAAFFETAGGFDIDPSTTAWCAAFMNSVLAASGIEGTGSLMAQSFLDFGTPVRTPSKGDIVVFERGASGSGKGHVGLVAGINSNGTLQVLGGNQSNSTSIETFKTDRVLGYRRINLS